MLHACGIASFLICLPESSSTQGGEATDTRTKKANSATLSRCATGDIKVTPEDFVVVEIDPSGQRTDAAPYVFPTADENNSTMQALDNDPDGAANVDEDEGKVGQETANSIDEISYPFEEVAAETIAPPSTRSLDDLHRLLAVEFPTIQKLFGSTTEIAKKVGAAFNQADLTALIRDVQLCVEGVLPTFSVLPKSDTTEASTLIPVPSTLIVFPWWRGSHCLGNFTDKKERQMMHRGLRRCFPHLRSYAEVPTTVEATAAPSCPALSASKKEAASVISCSLDLHYVLFCATMGAEAALCIARWAVAAQSARQERNLDEETQRKMQSITPLEDSVASTSVDKGVCYASFDPLTEVMRRPIGKLLPGDLDKSGLQKASSDVAFVSVGGEQIPLLSEKDVRRRVHDVLRRFYPFVTCQVRDGRAVLRYTPKLTPRNFKGNSGQSSGDVVLGVRRPRGEEKEDETAKTNISADISSSAPSNFLHFIVKKRNLDTAEMRQLIAEYCQLKDGAVCVAGMKDKKAVTTQRCSIPLTTASTITQAGYSALVAAAPPSPVILRWPVDPKNSYAAVLCAAARSVPVHLGQLKGNWFSVQVRNVRWATEDERARWRGNVATAQTTQSEELQGVSMRSHDDGDLHKFLKGRLQQCVQYGFINYFGQQRFEETIERPDDHTGVHLFAGRWVDAVKSLFRSCPDVYNAFPEKMEVRFVPGNSRDAQVMTHALRHTYRIFFSEHLLAREDVQMPSALWTQLCEKAITEGVAYFLRSLWVHAGQSVFFNLTASFIADGMMRPLPLASASTTATTATASHGLPTLPYTVVANAFLPLGGYQVNRSTPKENAGEEGNSAVWQAWQEAAIEHTLRILRWTKTQAFEQRKVAGVPVPGSMRAVVVRPQDAVLEWGVKDEPCADMQLSYASELPSMRLLFALPSSTYATIFLREVLGCDKWW